MSFISDWRQLRKLANAREEIREKFRKKTKELDRDKPKDPYAYSQLAADEHFEDELMDEALNSFLSDRLLKQAAKYDVELPPISENDDMWGYSEFGGRHYLGSKGRALVRELVHKEKERGIEDWERWIKVIAPVIGAIAALFGAATGVILALKK
jgi:hypothetical protein